MAWAPGEDADALVESALVAINLDGAEVRCPIVIFRAFGIRSGPLRRGETQGLFDLYGRQARFDTNGDEATVRGKAAHECGHLILCLAGRVMPHPEALASRCGRAVVFGRSYILRVLDELNFYEAVAHLSFWVPEVEVERRIWEVRRSFVRQVIWVAG